MISADVGFSGFVIASDVRPPRVLPAASTLGRCRVERIVRVRTDIAVSEPAFDLVVIDAPSAGTIRRDPDIRGADRRTSRALRLAWRELWAL